MKNKDIIQKIMEFRSQNLSFAHIARKLNLSKTSVYNAYWKEYDNQQLLMAKASNISDDIELDAQIDSKSQGVEAAPKVDFTENKMNPVLSGSNNGNPQYELPFDHPRLYGAGPFPELLALMPEFFSGIINGTFDKVGLKVAFKFGNYLKLEGKSVQIITPRINELYIIENLSKEYGALNTRYCLNVDQIKNALRIINEEVIILDCTVVSDLNSSTFYEVKKAYPTKSFIIVDSTSYKWKDFNFDFSLTTNGYIASVTTKFGVCPSFSIHAEKSLLYRLK